jgi:prepilin-type N-terminal cleavage/methylation domain-containing protein
MTARAHLRSRRADLVVVGQRSERGHDQGSTLIEVIVALAVIGVVMASLGTFFVGSMRINHSQGLVQAAGRIGGDGMEMASGLGGPALLSGRAACGSCTDPATARATAYLAGTQRWDAAAAGVTPTLPTPDQPEEIIVNGVTFKRYWFIGRCWQPANGGTCGVDTTQPAPYARLVVAVTWPGSECTAALCIRVTTALFSVNPAEPVFLQ